MKAVILAAGRGSRLLSLTDDRPKCLVDLHGKPLLHWQLGALKKAGIKDVLVVRGYLKEKIEGDFEVTENRKWDQTNMVGSLMCARQWLTDTPCIVSYSDIIYPPEAVERLMQAAHDARLAVLYDPNWLELWRRRFDNPLSDAESFVLQENGLVKDIGRPNVALDEIQGQYMGLLKFTPGSTQWVIDALEKTPELHHKLDMTGLLRLLINAGRPVLGVSWGGTWCEVDSRKDLLVAEKLFGSRN